jgi:hypothetical protein
MGAKLGTLMASMGNQHAQAAEHSLTSPMGICAQNPRRQW